MEQGFDLKVENFQVQLASLINNTELPTSTIMYIIKDYYNQIYTLYQKSVEKQRIDFYEGLKKEKEQNNKDNTEEAEE